MLAEQFGNLIRARRISKGLKQEDLARSAGVSRTVVSRLERCKPLPVQTDVLDRLLQALEIHPQVLDQPARHEARGRARLEQRQQIVERRNRHLRLAIELAEGGKRAAAMIAAARGRVELWRSSRACGAVYIERWSGLLKLHPRKLAQAMGSLGEWEDALFQNSPWSPAWN